MEVFSDIGKYLRIPRKQIHLREQEKESTPAVLIEAIAEKLKVNQRNYLPIIIEEVDEDEYEVLLNGHVLEAAEKANLDFVWCILADEKRGKQIEIESKQRFEVDLLTASETMISEMIQYIKKNYNWTQVDPEKAAHVIVQERSDCWKEVKDIIKTKEKFRIGEKKLPILEKYFCVGVS
jgi:hypothetical protein